MGTDQRRRILLVDDEPANLLALEVLLDGLGLALVKASSGAEALQRLLEQDFALILLDVRMKDMDGLQTAQLIRGRVRSRHTPIIFLTAFEDSEFPIVQDYALGAVDYLIKPLKGHILRAKVRVFVELFEKTEQIQRQAEQLRQLERQDFERQLTAEKQRREAVSRLAALVQSSEDAIIGAMLDGTITAWNPAAERIYGYAAAEMEGRPAAVLAPPERRDEAARILDWIRRGERVEQHETEGLTGNGQRIHVSLSVAPIKDGAGQTVGACLIARDITEHRRVEEKIRAHTTQLEAVNKELETFCSAVSHDLRAPLRAIDGFSQALLEDYGKHLDARGADYLQRVRAASQRMGQLIDDLLKLSRLGRGELRRDAVDLSALAQAVADDLRQRVPQRQVTFVTAQVGVVRGDGQLLRVVLDNLLGNAWKFTGKHLQARIEFGVGVHDGRVVYFVRDDGAGFDMAYSAKLFGAFQRLHSEREFSGTDIGLATVQRIIHRYGGEIWAEGAVEQGATFYFTLGPAGETGHA